MELLTSVLIAGGVCACIGAVKAVCRKLVRNGLNGTSPRSAQRLVPFEILLRYLMQVCFLYPYSSASSAELK